MLNSLRLRILVFVALAIAFAPPARAADPLPGDSCTTAGHFKQISGAEIPGGGYFIICDGANWVSVAEFARDGMIHLGPALTGADEPSGSGGGGGGGASGGNDASLDPLSFTDVNDAALDTLFESDIIQVQGISTGVHTYALNTTNIFAPAAAEYRICADGACSSVLLDWGTGLGTVYNGQFVQLRATSPDDDDEITKLQMSFGVALGGLVVPWKIKSPLAPCTSVGGYCWYLGQDGESCDETCAQRGGYDTATASYAGSGGSNANCESVMSALGAPGSTVSGVALGYNTGCFVLLSVTTRYRDTSATTSAATVGGGRRACACNS